MTFDEAIEKSRELSLDGTQQIYSDDVVRLINNLRQEYAPTIEMTKEQADFLKSLVIDVSKEFDEDDLPSDGSIKTTDKMIELDEGYLVLRYMNAILHPETIKVVDE